MYDLNEMEIVDDQIMRPFTIPYNKIKKERLNYQELCIWINENAYKPSVDPDQLGQYIWLCVYMYSHRAFFFRCIKDFVDFCYDAAEELLLQYLTPRTCIYNVITGEPLSKKIKNLDAYLNVALPAKKVGYQNSVFSQTFDGSLSQTIARGSSSQNSAYIMADIRTCVNQFPNTIKAVLKESYYKKNSNIFNYLYYSCLKTMAEYLETYDNIFHNNNIIHVHLWHLDYCYTNYIRYVIRKSLYILRNDIISIAGRANKFELYIVNDSLKEVYEEE